MIARRFALSKMDWLSVTALAVGHRVALAVDNPIKQCATISEDWSRLCKWSRHDQGWLRSLKLQLRWVAVRLPLLLRKSSPGPAPVSIVLHHRRDHRHHHVHDHEISTTTQDLKYACSDAFGAGCSCLQGRCYRFIDMPGRPGAPWCWTQSLGVTKPKAQWANCTNPSQCDLCMTCGDENRCIGTGTLVTTILGPVAANYCNGSCENGCDCEHGYCYCFMTVPGKQYAPRCWTPVLGKTEPSKQYVTFTVRSECHRRLVCADADRHSGSEVVPVTTAPAG